MVPLARAGSAELSTRRWAGEQLCPSLTFDAGDLLALRLAEEVQLVGDGLQHLDEVGQEEDDVDVVIGEVPPAADALRPLDVGAAQQGDRGPLVHVLRVQPEGRPKGNVNKPKDLPPSSCKMQINRCLTSLPLPRKKKEPTSFCSADTRELFCLQVPSKTSLPPQQTAVPASPGLSHSQLVPCFDNAFSLAT